jgi:hypothetical protein
MTPVTHTTVSIITAVIKFQSPHYAKYYNFRRELAHTLSLTESYVTTDGQSVCLGIKHPSGAYDQIFFLFGIRNTSDSYVLHSVGRPL